MAKKKKISFSLSEQELDAVDSLTNYTGENRSVFIGRIVREEAARQGIVLLDFYRRWNEKKKEGNHEEDTDSL